MNEKRAPEVSVVIPLYNEERRLAGNYEKITAYLAAKHPACEIILVDDKSTDRTIAVARGLMRRHGEERLLALGCHLGKGGAVREGMLRARGAYIVFMDADLSTPIEELAKFEPLMRSGADVMIGSRKKEGARIMRRQPRLREFLGKMFTRLGNALVAPGISDFTCGFKGFSARAARKIFSHQRITDWSFDAEILFLAQRFRYPIHEIPVLWRNERGSKVRVLRDVCVSLLGLLRIKTYDFLGAYRTPLKGGASREITLYDGL
ncbi:MAG: dolichyl-phosphate beta-glucosyltransferase [Deltaproteobacteria bacterium]